jgi:membrane protease YdiL (CAAX protease family)
MQVLGTKKFFLDYLAGSGLIFLLFLMLTGDITALDTGATLKLSQTCHSSFLAKDVLQSIGTSIRSGESCEMVSPCVEWQTVRCEGSVPMSGLFGAMYKNNLLVFRVKESNLKSYGIWNYKDSSAFRLPLSFILLLLAYGVVLAETVAVLFALWRQDKLRQTLTLPLGSRKHQIIHPALWALLLAMVVVVMNYLVYDLFDHPQINNREVVSTLLNSVAGIGVIAIVGPLAEELIFRGVLLRFFIEKNRLLSGTVFVSVLFAAMHGYAEQSTGWQLYLFAIYFLVSVILCRLFITQKTIWSPIVFHSVYNSTMVVLHMVSG